MFTGIYLDPGHGFTDNIFDFGLVADNMQESSLVDTFLSAIEDELRIEAVPVEIIPSRIRPGVSAEDRGKIPIQNSIIIHCHIGEKKKNGRQYGNVYCLHNHGLCNCISSIIDKWGFVRSKTWDSCKISKANFPWFNADSSCLHIQIEPMVVGCVDSDILSASLEKLGKDIGQVISLYMKTQNKEIKFRGAMEWLDPKVKLT